MSTQSARIQALAQRIKAHGIILAQKLQASQIYKRITDKPWTAERIQKNLWRIRYPLLFFVGMMVGDLALQSLVVFLPKPKISALRANMGPVPEEPFLKARAHYDSIVSRNLFCPGCPVPDMKARAFERPKDCSKASPMKNASLKLVGTIVLSNPNFSVATFSRGSESLAYKKGDSIGGGLSVFEIRTHRVCFVNQDGILNFIEMPVEGGMQSFGKMGGENQGASTEGIVRKSEGEFEIKRSTLAAKIQDPNLLFQAAASPYYENGVIAGFKIDSIVPGSVYETLGIQPEDIVTAVNGAPIDSVAKATEIYSSVNTASEISIEIMRGGRKMTQTYKITK